MKAVTKKEFDDFIDSSGEVVCYIEAPNLRYTKEGKDIGIIITGEEYIHKINQLTK